MSTFARMSRMSQMMPWLKIFISAKLSKISQNLTYCPILDGCQVPENTDICLRLSIVVNSIQNHTR